MRRFAWFGVFGLAVACASLGPAIEPDDEAIAAVHHGALVPFETPVADPDPPQARVRTPSPRVRSLVAGGYHACVLQRDATVACWGRNDFGQLGNGSRADTRTAIEIGDLLDDVAQIAAGLEHTCARLDNGQVRCWGANPFGQLGDGTDTGSATPRTVIGIDDAIDLQLGDFEACVVRQGGGIACWGGNLGGMPIAMQPDTAWRATPRPEHYTGQWPRLAVTQQVRCRWGPSGAECWGSPDFDGCRGEGRDDASKCVTAELTNVIDFDLGLYLACAVIDDGTVQCFGSASYGQTPTAGNACYANYPEPGCPRALVGLAPAVQVALGAWHACALHDDGAVSCWGTNNFGQTGAPTAPTEALRWRDVIAPALVYDWVDVVEIDAGRGFTCARMRDGDVACMGDLAEGRLPKPLFAPRPL